MNDFIPVLFVAGIMVVGLVLVIMLIQNLLIVVPPNKVLVISGRSHQTAEGDTLGYRVIRGGRAFRIPVLEKVSWMDLTTIPLDLTVENAYSRGGIPLKIHAVANVKINGSDPQLGNAIERFLDVPRASLTNIVRDTLEGNLRGVIATLTPEEINQDRLRFAESLIEEAEHDMNNLGIKLDTLKIQNVSDIAGYLESIGRRQTAEVLKEARVAAEQQLEQERITLNQKRLEADVVAPARASREAELLAAQAVAAPIIEEGRARAEAVKLMVEAFRDAGPGGERAYVLNMLPAIVEQITGSVRGMQIDKVTVIDSGDGRAVRSAIQTMPSNIIGLVEQVENATGVNLLSMLQNRFTPGETPAPTDTVSAAND